MTTTKTPFKAPELLMPAGSPQKMHYALAYGADAVYAGVPFFSLRARENDFTLDELQKGIQFTHDQGKKFYLTANIFARNLKINSFVEQIDQWAPLKPDAMIMGDPGLIAIVKERHPEIPIHLSVQANCMNWRAVKFWHSMGVERVILSRELRLDEIKEIKQRVPEIELEAFVHGAICIAYSGRCLLSHYMSYRDANQGVCDNSCRYPYKVFKGEEAKEEEFYIQDQRDKELFYPIEEDEHGTYIMNAKDLRLIEYLREIAEAGVCSFKVEGRTKTVYYAAMVAKTYRQAIDDVMRGQKFNPSLLGELDKVANRGYHSGFMVKDLSHESQNYTDSNPQHSNPSFAGLYLSPGKEENTISVDVRNKIQVGQKCEIISPDGSQKSFIVEKMFSDKGAPIEVVSGGSGKVQILANFQPKPYSIVRIYQ